MDNCYLADLLYPNIQTLPEDMEKRYPPRQLPEGAKVTRFAPSPTGFLHIGNLYGAFTDERLAHTTGGIFYLRIEDTDAKRTVPNGVALIIETLAKLGVCFDEGAVIDGDNGAYGPYRQSERAEIYQTYAKQLIREGKAYPCFCTEEELEAIRAKQEAEKKTPGYYGEYAVWRDAPIERIEAALADGKPFVLRFRSEGDISHKFKFTDEIKGVIDVTENDVDHVILKSDGIPTYHFAHAVDDHLMRTTHVVRDESWLSTLPFHIQLFKALGFKLPKYCHTAQVLKLDDGNKRKISKRKDPEAALTFYHAEGYPAAATREYLMTLLNSNFEEWRIANPTADIEDFKFTTKKMSVSGSLFDLDKLNDVSKNVISRMTAEEAYRLSLAWAKEFDPAFAAIYGENGDYGMAILAIGRGGAKPRKDLTTWKDVKDYVSFFYDALFTPDSTLPENVTPEDAAEICRRFAETYDPADDQPAWFAKIKQIAADLGYAPETKLYKKDPSAYKGHVGDVSMVLRIAVTGRQNSPDLFEVMHILGCERTIARLSAMIHTKKD
ncbi:MAG: glutamate--tRNA ligase [Clostridiales bacterium]|nr:glutamate--tRNA ligase [Clostridiales bacterium]MDD7310588.1 glutamate--tRNA ligase [Eubacteriales bacterium]MDY5346417.1 glutamate--tRNA ligase [Eubacteriales bacterium]